MQLGLENKKQTKWAIVLGVVAVLAIAYVLIPMFTGSTAATSSIAPVGTPASNPTAHAAGLLTTPKAPAGTGIVEE